VSSYRVPATYTTSTVPADPIAALVPRIDRLAGILSRQWFGLVHADDLAAEGMVAVLAKRERIAARGYPEGLAVTIARQGMLDTLKVARRHQERFETCDLVGDADAAGRLVVQADPGTGLDFETIIEQVPDGGTHELLRAMYLRGESMGDAGREVGLSEGQAARRLKIAMRGLRRKLRPENDPATG
jgi:DNA-directed RNA polymerase specialized sigma24 family protein